ncbi:MAG: flagellar M-ring protein FliF [Candidatus Cloacimonadota bacterium]|nr:MAG: flagellar M-ring protein FliF [Candidatus Cloacimonadota bacterium]
MKDQIANLKGAWEKLSTKQKVGSSVTFFSVLIVITLFVSMYSGDTYVPIFDYIKDRREALAVKSKLKELGFKVRSSDAGHVIEVVRDRREEAHLALAEARALPNAVLDYADILDANSSFGLTEKELDVKIQRAKEGALAKTIMHYRNIEYAKIHIERAEASLFSVDQKETRVSVLIQLEDPLADIKVSQVKTMIRLVEHSVLGVKKDNIFISDDKGRDLISLIHEKDKNVTHHDLTSKKEKDLKRKAQKSLAEIYGEKNVNVEVNLDLNFDTVSEESKELAPPVAGEDQGVKISEELKETESSTKDPKAIPGTTSNIPGYQAPDLVSSFSKSKEQRVNYAYKQKSQIIKKALGSIRRMTVSVVINLEVLPDKKLTDETKQTIIDLVSTSVGFDSKNRNDQISVAAFIFNRIAQERKSREDTKLRAFEAKLFTVGIVCGFFSLLLFGLREYRIFSRTRRAEMLEMAQRSIEEQSEQEEEVLTVEQREKNERERLLMEIAREEPETLVKIIRTIMFDESYY